MTARERILTTLKHKEPDRVPYDLDSTLVTGITKIAYANLLSYLKIQGRELTDRDIVQQLVFVDEDIKEKFGVATRGVPHGEPSSWNLELKKESNNYVSFVDKWGIKWAMPENGFYYDMTGWPLKDATLAQLESHNWPNFADSAITAGLKEKAKYYHDKGYAVLVGPVGGGFFEMASWLCGYERFYTEIAEGSKFALRLMDILHKLRFTYWENIFKEMGEYIDVAIEAEDLGGQNGLLISPAMYRKYIKTMQKELNAFIKSKKPDVLIFLHSCGSIYDILGDIIETGFDIVNPVQVSAGKMDSKALKREFGKDITFWGGIDTHYAMPRGTVKEVRDEVKRRLDDFAPGGGYVCTTVHNIQADVPPQNIIAMIETLEEYGVY